MEVKEMKVTKADDSQKSETMQLIVFRIGAEEYALHIDQIKEVVITPHITRMPQTPAFVRGVANIRGNIIAIIDLEEKFGLKDQLESSDSEGNYTLVIESEEFKMGVLVKEVPNTLAVSAADIEDTTNVIQESGMDQGYIRGVVKVGDRLLILIDIFKIMSDQEFDKVFTKKAAVKS
jgi:purine-binding chemotaxis protein CheW